MQNLTGSDGAVRQSSAIRSSISMAFLSWCSVVSEVSSWLQFLWLASVGTAVWASSPGGEGEVCGCSSLFEAPSRHSETDAVGAIVRFVIGSGLCLRG